MSDTSQDFLNIVRDLISEETTKTDQTVICRIHSINSDGTLNIILPSDEQTVLYNIYNCSPYDFQSGDNAVLFKINNKTNNAFIMAKTTKELPKRISADIQDIYTKLDAINENIKTINAQIGNINTNISDINTKITSVINNLIIPKVDEHYIQIGADSAPATKFNGTTWEIDPNIRIYGTTVWKRLT